MHHLCHPKHGENDVPVLCINNFFSSTETSNIISTYKTKLPVSDERASTRRQRLQSDVEDPYLTSVLWSRLISASLLSAELHDIIYNLKIPDDSVDDSRDLSGAWHADHLRPRSLFAAYTETDFFGAHFDSRVEEPGYLSHITLLVYLNERGVDFEGGTTNILNFGCKLGSERMVADESGVISRISPTAGSAVLFFQESMWHEGGSVISGVKYILRSDVMFTKNCASSQHDENICLSGI